VTAKIPSILGRFLRLYLWALLAALIVGFAIGLVIRDRLERPRIYVGSLFGSDTEAWTDG
jgi:hypothetical protein